MDYNFAIISPLANEAKTFELFTEKLSSVLDNIGGTSKVYLVIDNVSHDNTLELSNALSKKDDRFVTVWAPENKNVVDAYIRGYKEALKEDFEYILEIDAGLSHDPSAIPMFLRALSEGHYCAFGSRFINGGSIYDSDWKRTFLSRSGTILSNCLLGTKMKDMTSGYMGFHREVVSQIVSYGLRSKAHFYQTEVRYLLRKSRYIEVPIHYIAPSPNVSKKAILNSLSVLFYYFVSRLVGKSRICSDEKYNANRSTHPQP
jgi:dolichol-phosphate mannosyltransferase